VQQFIPFQQNCNAVNNNRWCGLAIRGGQF
jgi:hypothetical protein